MARNAKLIVQQPGQRIQKFEISGRVATIGRANGNAIRLCHDRKVSRHHAVITAREDGYWFSDLTTRNGTTINGTIVESEQKLVNGDLICLGGGTSTIEFSLSQQEPREQPKPTDHPASINAENDELTNVSTFSTPKAKQSKLSLSAILLGILGGAAVIAVFGGILFAAGAVSWKKSNNVGYRKADLPPQEALSTSSEQVDETPTPEPEVPPDKPINQPTPESKASGEAEAAQAQILAAKISPKNYRFDPAFVALIGGYVDEYRTAGGYYGRARKYKDAIDKEFVNVQGLPPIFGYVMAMSRTKFLEGSGDVWGLPNSVIKIEGPVDSESKNTAGSTKIAASYIRGLWDVFGQEGFMYAVACYGMTLDQAGAVQQQIELKDPTGQARYDFWRMKNMGVVKGEQVERVARFFAAGMVIENPEQFGLSEPSVSTLY